MGERWLIDYDSTLADTQEMRLDVVNQKFGTNYNKEGVTSWNSEGYFEDDHAAYMWGPECFMSNDVQANAPPVPGALEGMQRLLDVGEHLMIVSDRPESLFEVTRDWLDRYGLDMVRLLFTRHKHSMNVSTTGMTKAQAAYLYQLRNVVEDAPHHAQAMAARTYVNKVFLLDMPYNQSIEDSKIKRVADWSEIIQYVDESFGYEGGKSLAYCNRR